MVKPADHLGCTPQTLASLCAGAELLPFIFKAAVSMESDSLQDGRKGKGAEALPSIDLSVFAIGTRLWT